MLCDICKKNEATVHIKEFHNGQCETHHLCAECAGKKEQQGDFGSLGFKLSEILFDPEKLNNFINEKGKKDDAGELPAAVCPECSWTTAKIRESNGKIGCPECYKVFAPILAEAFSKVQRGTLHLGKHPADKDDQSGQLRQELKRLQTELADLVAAEEYEKAAVCRDRINAIRKELEAR